MSLLDKACVIALLDDNQPALTRLLEITQMTVGERCIYCNEKTVEDIGDGWECSSCGEIYYQEQIDEECMDHLESLPVKTTKQPVTKKACIYCKRPCTAVTRQGEPACARCKKTYGAY